MSALPRLHPRAHVFSGLTALMLCLATAIAPAMAGVRTHALTLAGAVPALSTGFAHMPHVNPEAPKGGTLRLGVIGGFDSLHPFIMRGIPAAQLGLTYETLGETVPGEDGVIYGLLAESFEESADGGHLVCHLAPAARFADGHPVTAADVVFSFEMLTRHGSPFYRDYYAGVGTVTAVDARTVRFDFTSRHNAELPYIVAQLPVLPRHWWQGRDFTAPQAEAAPGSGPYRVREARPGSGITYERVPGWWGAKLPINRGRYNFDVIRCDYYRDTTVARQAFLAGEFDLWNENTIKDWFASYDVPSVREGRITREEIPHGRPEGMGGFVFNTRRAIFADVRVRRALAMCFDFEWTNRALFHDAYRRYDSFFSNSPFAATGTATEGERALLREVSPERAAMLSGPPPSARHARRQRRHPPRPARRPAPDARRGLEPARRTPCRCLGQALQVHAAALVQRSGTRGAALQTQPLAPRRGDGCAGGRPDAVRLTGACLRLRHGACHHAPVVESR